MEQVRLLQHVVAESEASLRQALNRVEEAEHATARGSWEWDTVADRATWSKGMYRLFGVDPTRFDNSNANFLALVHPDDRQGMLDAMTAALHSPGRFYQEYRLVTPGGDVRYLRGEGNVVPDASGKARLMYGFVQDVTQAKKAEQHLQDFKAHFMEVMAHDLNNVMTPLALTARLVGDELTQADRGNSTALQRLNQNVSRLQEFLATMLDACRMQSGQLRIIKLPYDVVPSIQAAIEELKLQAAAKGITVETRLPPSLVIHADWRRIEQVIGNLFSNAVKFTPAGGTIRIGARVASEAIRVWVQDTGRGIASSDVANLFQPFSRVGQAEQGKHTGTGLGLFICRGIIEGHGGTMHCQSPGIDQGTTFTFTLPMKASEAHAQSVPHARPLH